MANSEDQENIRTNLFSGKGVSNRMGAHDPNVAINSCIIDDNEKQKTIMNWQTSETCSLKNVNYKSDSLCCYSLHIKH